MRRLAPALVLVVVLAGCGGGGTEGAMTLTSPPVTTAPADPGKATISAFTAAARERSPAAMWRELSTASRDRLGPTRAAFERLSAPKLRKRFGSFRHYKVIVSERIASELGVVAIDDGRRVDAVALRLEGTTWKVELGGPVRIRLLGQPLLVQVAAAVEGPGGVGTAVMYIDGETVNPKVAGTASNSTLYANLVPALDPGRHTIVIFASDGREASAAAWAFTARE